MGKHIDALCGKATDFFLEYDERLQDPIGYRAKLAAEMQRKQAKALRGQEMFQNLLADRKPLLREMEAHHRTDYYEPVLLGALAAPGRANRVLLARPFIRNLLSVAGLETPIEYGMQVIADGSDLKPSAPSVHISEYRVRLDDMAQANHSTARFTDLMYEVMARESTTGLFANDVA